MCGNSGKLTHEFTFSVQVVLHKKRGFPLKISPVSVAKSTGNCEFGHIYCRNPKWKTSFFLQFRQNHGPEKHLY